MKVEVPMAKNILTSFGITACASEIDAEVQKRIHGSGVTTLIISNEDMNYIMKIVRVLEDYNILLKGITKTIKNETKEQKGEFLSMLLSTLGARLLWNLLKDKIILRAGYGAKRAGYGLKKKILTPPYPITNFETHENEPRFNGAFSKDNLSKTIKNGAYVINLDDADVGTHWIALFFRKTEIVYFDSFCFEHVPE